MQSLNPLLLVIAEDHIRKLTLNGQMLCLGLGSTVDRRLNIYWRCGSTVNRHLNTRWRSALNEGWGNDMWNRQQKWKTVIGTWRPLARGRYSRLSMCLNDFVKKHLVYNCW